ncbi:M14 family zinc carboxypeptidase [Halegenticoccus tardaugens]|uniref:M14 family zinc carboxypeptidase n=1 Tax=Halegenticoccus tardaugens TaxID=2071624 RepID=UPI00100B198D|nr:M14 family zinc carboxypeptidase [Halegenticoccus tardaugens]
MRRRTYLRSTGAALFGLGAAGAASADESGDRRGTYRPGGPRQGSERSINLNAFHTNEQLTKALRKLDGRSDRIRLAQIGESADAGDPIWEVTVGEGDTNVHLITQIHGDEAVGTEVALKVLKDLADGGSSRIERILDELTLTVIPRVNPDGAMYEYDVDDDGRDEWVGRRTNTQAWEEGDSRYEPYYHYASPEGTEPGYDMNRDFNIRPPSEFDPRTDDREEWWTVDGDEAFLDMPYEGYELGSSGLRLAPEVRAVTESYLRADPDFAITHHHQSGGYLVPDSDDGNEPPKQTIMSVMAAYGPAYRDRAPYEDPDLPVERVVNPFIDDETSARSLRMNALVADALAERGDSVFDSITRYGYGPLWGSYLDSLTPHTDAPGMLYEVSYQTGDIGQKALGRMMEATKVGFWETFDALAEGTLDEVDEERYFDVPLHGEPISARR